MMNKPNQRTQSSWFLLLITVFSFLLMFFSMYIWHQHSLYHQELVSSKVKANSGLKQTRLTYNAHKQKINKQAQNAALKSKDPKVKTVALHNLNYSIAQDSTANYFKIFYNWDNTSDYRARPKELKGKITSNLANNRKIFDNGNDTTGHSYIAAMRLHSKYVYSQAYLLDPAATGTIHSLVRVNNEGWYTGRKRAISAEIYQLDMNQRGVISNMKYQLTANPGTVVNSNN